MIIRRNTLELREHMKGYLYPRDSLFLSIATHVEYPKTSLRPLQGNSVSQMPLSVDKSPLVSVLKKETSQDFSPEG